MICKYTYGRPIQTDAVVVSLSPEEKEQTVFQLSEDRLVFTYYMEKEDLVYGLGEAVRGINKRGWHYTSCCSDDPNHTETKQSLYGAHNFLMVIGTETFGVFFDYPGIISFDIGYTQPDLLTVTLPDANLDLYIIRGLSPLNTVLSFRKLTGRSYAAPRWAFGYLQSRWGYRNAEDIREIVQSYRQNELPLDSVCLDIDYMTDYESFTVSEERFPDFPKFVQEMREDHIRLVPIIDAGIKIADGYNIYEEGKANDYFCKRADGSCFVAGVWPGLTHFPDFLNSKAREWFGNCYRRLLDSGIEGFWNDMNEPAIFYSEESLAEAKQEILRLFNGTLDVNSFFRLIEVVNSSSNNPKDYRLFYHNIDGHTVRHDKVHNLFGYNMTRAAGEAFERLYPNHRMLLFSRASYIGAHRYGGIWTGDNQSWWSHLLLNIKMMPSLNMCGFLYSGADLGGFGSDTTADLVLRWLAFGIFTPLMRNHSAHDTRPQEAFRFAPLSSYRRILLLRYRLIAYIYSEYMKAVINDGLLFRPLLFDYPEDIHASQVEDQLILGDGLMLTPVYEQNANGRYVYLPEDMLFLKFISEESVTADTLRLSDGTPITTEMLSKGHHYIEVEMDEVPLFIRPGHLLPLTKPAQAEELIDYTSFEIIAYAGDRQRCSYELYSDDGFSRSYDASENTIRISVVQENGTGWNVQSDREDITVLGAVLR